MQDVLLPFFSNNIFSYFCNACNIKPGFKAIETERETSSYSKGGQNMAHRMDLACQMILHGMQLLF